MASGGLLARIPTGDYPRGLARDAQGRIYVANSSDGTVSVIDPATRSVIRTIVAGEGVDALATGAGGQRVVALSTAYPTAYVIDSASGTPSARSVGMPAVLRPGGERQTSAPAMYYTYRSLVVSPSGDRIHAVTDANGTVVISLADTFAGE